MRQQGAAFGTTDGVDGNALSTVGTGDFQHEYPFEVSIVIILY